MNFLKNILNIIFPINCIGCNKAGIDLCPQCLSLSPEPGRESAEWVFPIYDYRYPIIKKSIWLLKYKNRKGFAKIFAETMYERIVEELSDLTRFNNFTQPILIPIPLTKKRMRERGFNQSMLICEELIKLDKKNNIFSLEKNILVKIKNGTHQVLTENKYKRLKNILNSFSIQNCKKIENRNIILIDDVTTTGATLSEAKKILKKNGVKKVIAFTVAH